LQAGSHGKYQRTRRSVDRPGGHFKQAARHEEHPCVGVHACCLLCPPASHRFPLLSLGNSVLNQACLL
jgi:hypothetical protein